MIHANTITTDSTTIILTTTITATTILLYNYYHGCFYTINEVSTTLVKFFSFGFNACCSVALEVNRAKVRKSIWTLCMCAVTCVNFCLANTSLCFNSLSEESDIFCWRDGKHWGVSQIWFWAARNCRRTWQLLCWKNNVTCQRGKQWCEESSCVVTSNSNSVKNVCGPDIIKGNDFLINWHEDGCIKRNEV